MQVGQALAYLRSDVEALFQSQFVTFVLCMSSTVQCEEERHIWDELSD